jgi:hypothetical protein
MKNVRKSCKYYNSPIHLDNLFCAVNPNGCTNCFEYETKENATSQLIKKKRKFKTLLEYTQHVHALEKEETLIFEIEQKDNILFLFKEYDVLIRTYDTYIGVSGKDIRDFADVKELKFLPYIERCVYVYDYDKCDIRFELDDICYHFKKKNYMHDTEYHYDSFGKNEINIQLTFNQYIAYMEYPYDRGIE